MMQDLATARLVSHLTCVKKLILVDSCGEGQRFVPNSHHVSKSDNCNTKSKDIAAGCVFIQSGAGMVWEG